MGQVGFKLDGKSYKVEVKPLTVELFKKFVVGISAKAALLDKLAIMMDSSDDIDKIERMSARIEEIETQISSAPMELGALVVEAISIDGKLKEDQPSTKELLCIGTVVMKTCAPKQEELKNLGN